MSLDLIIVTINNDPRMLENILSQSIDINYADYYVANNFIPYINSCDPIYGNTALHYAVKMGNFDIIQILLSYGANRNIKNFKGILPMDEFQDRFLSNLLLVP
jgi:ankyrin repeat protein